MSAVLTPAVNHHSGFDYLLQGSLDLEELEEGSPLELCYVLGKLQERGEFCMGAMPMPLSLLRHQPMGL